ncbi:A24 family peptidase [Erwinia tracheiphila]|uniref:Prepilin leader peptidase/N-methyltransferase n=1 Tax=Erwinia tracheiphila TaxID=65700 RepID=A0A0M2KJX8_9GAMM|nr:A24 family peptidase [Erwinia tracheiphila]KKF37533.1 prepilin peptidase [Erwinia tracheiphila]UIA88937.1 A24 family peptidase [Erwinia tracheiphila]UIA97317.1 A24 family peptidase [Erwinia tracheiphila]
MELWPVLVYIAGLIAGSVISCLACRLPMMLHLEAATEADNLPGLLSKQRRWCTYVSLFSPRAHCRFCLRAMAFYHTIPLLGWLWLHRRCHHCQRRIGWRYPLTELTAAVSSGWVALHCPPGITAIALILCGWVLLLLALIDLECMLLPDNLTLSLLWLGLLINLNGAVVSLHDAVVGALSGYLALWMVYWIFKIIRGKEGLGYGDFKLFAALGAWCGWQSLPRIMLCAALLGVSVHLLFYLFGKRKQGQLLPFGPWLALSGWWFLITPITTG